uniref:Uncharacterized protein n=2 Tax=Spironucleus salmonicida TaxID=348837 RepID=V6LPL9_9EUKA|eukprot:EST46565.1 hypothetical protein SS50377_13369 [Spironucleus salmonicida]
MLEIQLLRKLRRKRSHQFLQYSMSIFIIKRCVKNKIYLNKLYKQNDSSYEIEETPRMKLIKKFVTFYEVKYKEPIINSQPEFRNVAFRDYCGRIILQKYIQSQVYLKYYQSSQPIYVNAASVIFNAYKKSPVSQNEYIFLVKVKRLQRMMKGIIYRNYFILVKQSIFRLSDSQQTNPLSLMKLLDYSQYSLLDSFQTPFTLKFRLGSCDGQFLPKIYYKIFLVGQSVTDVSVTAPRNYAIERETGVIDKRLWYIRVTNQPWTPIDGKEDIIFLKSKAVPRPAATKAQVELCKKQRRLKWQQESRKKFIMEKLGLGTLDDYAELEDWGQQLDYMVYADDWINTCSNIYDKFQFNDEINEQLQDIKQQIEMVELQEVDKMITADEKPSSKDAKRLVSSVCKEFSDILDVPVDDIFEDGNAGGFRVNNIE